MTASYITSNTSDTENKISSQSEESFLSRQNMLIGEAATAKLQNSRILLFGCGGVGSYILEALVRAGVEQIGIVDFDTVSKSNINRQLIADETTLGKKKTSVAKDRAEKINRNAIITEFDIFATKENIPNLISDFAPDYIADAVDNISAKLSIIEEAKRKNIPIISSMGTGNKLDPSRFKITDISKTSVCPLARVVRRELRKRGIEHVTVLYSDEIAKSSSTVPASISYVPSVAGLFIAGHIIRDITNV